MIVEYQTRPADQLLGHETLLKRTSPVLALEAEPPAPSYYDIPFLKKPVWTWEIGCYFFLGGLSAGSYVLARLAERAGGDNYRALTRAGTYIACAAAMPCPLLLISDLGDPRRFHHMLRVFKPRSPMSLGMWALTGYSAVLFASVFREWLRAGTGRNGIPIRMASLALDAAGLPLALLFSGYTGVLLSGTATPVWTQNPWLGPLFTASAMGNAAAAIQLALKVNAAEERNATQPSSAVLGKIETTAHAAEASALAGYVTTAGSLAKPLTSGKAAPFFWGAVAAAATSELLRHAPVRQSVRPWLHAASSLLGLASGFCLKWAIYQAGTPSAQDPDANRKSSRPS